MSNIRFFKLQMDGLCIFREILTDEVICALHQLCFHLSSKSGDDEMVNAYASFYHQLLRSGAILDFGAYVEDKVLNAKASMAHYFQYFKGVSYRAEVLRNLKVELEKLQNIAQIDGRYLKKCMEFRAGEDIKTFINDLPEWENPSNTKFFKEPWPEAGEKLLELFLKEKQGNSVEFI